MKNADQENLFAAWLGDAKPGDEYVYAANATRVSGAGGIGRNKIAEQAWRYSERGLVSLVQRRVSHTSEIDGGGTFDYIAQRTRKVA